MSQPSEAVIVYDGDCPFCSRYVRLVRLREALGSVRLEDARAGTDSPIVQEVLAKGFDLDEGMVLKLDGQYYHGADCVHMMALLSGPSGVLNRMNAALFRHRGIARFLYPFLRAGRNLTVTLRGSKKLSDSGIAPADADANAAASGPDGR